MKLLPSAYRLLFCILCFVSPALAAETDIDSDYAVLLARAKVDPARTDFGKLRMAFTKTPAYQPYDRYTADDKEFDTAMAAENLARAREIVDRLLEKNYVRIRSHINAFIVHDKKGDAERAHFHRAFVDGLFRSIVSSGDGGSRGTAFVIINTEEEYDVIGLSGMKLDSQGLQHEGGKSFDVMTVTPRDGGQAVQLYFDITLPWKNSPFGKGLREK